MYLYLFTSTGWKFICTVCSIGTILISTNCMQRGLGLIKVYITCTDQGIFIRGGGGVLTAFSVCLFCVVLKLLTEGFQWFYFRGGLSFSRGSTFFRGGGGGGGGVRMLISIETHI